MATAHELLDRQVRAMKGEQVESDELDDDGQPIVWEG